MGPPAPAKVPVHLWRLGRLRYEPALRVQQGLARRLKEAAAEDRRTGRRKRTDDNGASSQNSRHVLLSVEHDPVYTTGIRTGAYSPGEEGRLRALGAEFVRADRGGLITFHGPGQLVAYPVLDLAQFVPAASARKALLGMKWYLHQLEQSVLDTCASLGVSGAHRSPHTGVWVGDGAEERKVCAMGVHNSGFVTTHGLAINCDTDLKWFSHIIPCGIEGKAVTSLSLELGRRVTTEEVLPHLVRHFESALGCRVVDEPPDIAKEVWEEAGLRWRQHHHMPGS